ncbi:site-specific DNA-methyltransferase [Hydrogenivirga sp. 128-5-R1-1]|uniref:site-specific DNA-methyltransferase n=1 Tax=Hydrogenivirga sp. 128-5-R1-1 TaxID=392423 RepID=UPI00015F32BD|nr:site-specific DNA-methyltransferase [Hydrogenivirga sp. 128-5-R1-1]EDP74828.1 Adenine-specific DNA methylase [Hydrogenivirga sp. 128-5-R1-1]
MDREKLFFSALRDVFVGAKVEGESGFVNLMRIKSSYYEKGIFPRLREDIEILLDNFKREFSLSDEEIQHFREELFDRLYTFFRRYFSESGSIYFRFTPPHEHVYEKVYTDDQDVALFWKTHMLYYVKTDRLFRSMAVEVDGFRFFFDVSTLEHKRANEKRLLVYDFKERREDGTLVFTVNYSERGRKTNIANIRRAIKDAIGLNRYTSDVPSEETLERAFRLFERQSEVDYFINKDARKFLREQFNLWLYQYVFEPEERRGTVWTEKRIRQLQVLKDIAYKIIDFIAQFEDELVKIWNKPKFVLGSHYVITLDRIAVQEGGIEVLDRLLSHPGMEAQVQEWRELGMVGEDFSPEQVWVEKGKRLHEHYQYLPIDTKHFPDLEMTVLTLFDHLDQELDGWLVHSENYQALNTMLPKFREKVRCVYIDPPYNSESTEIDYVNQYKHSSWMSLMDNRLALAKDFLCHDGIICVSIDDNEVIRLKEILGLYFSEEVATCVIRSNPAGRSTPKGVSVSHEYAVFFAKSEKVVVGKLQRNENQIARYREQDEKGAFEWVNFRKHGGLKEEAPRMYYPIYINKTGRTWRIPRMRWCEKNKVWEILEEPNPDEVVVWPTDEHGQPRRWKWTPERLMASRNEVKVDYDRFGQLTLYIKSRMPEGITPSTWWDRPEYSATDYGTRGLKDLFGYHGIFSYPKAVNLVMDCIRVSSGNSDNAFVLDFFAGSGTTAHAVINLNREDGGKRKYILVEMADYFNTVLLPRIKKVIFSDKWKDGKAQSDGKGISHFVKYFRLEQYEEVLRKAHYQDNDAPLFFQDDPYTQYAFLRDPKMLDNAETGEKVMEVDMDKNEIRVDLSRLYPDIDLAETLSCLTGKWIRRIRPAEDDPTKPGTVEFEDGPAVDLQNPPWELVKPLIWW